jgi:hypothetical protein
MKEAPARYAQQIFDLPPRHGRPNGWTMQLPIRSALLAMSASGRASQYFGGIIPRSFLSSPLVVVGKGLKLTRNCLVCHGLGSAEQSPCCL